MINQMAMNNNMNFVNPMMNQNFKNNNYQLQQMLQQQMQIQAMQNQQQLQQEMMMKQQNERQLKDKGELLVLQFNKYGKNTKVRCNTGDKIADVLEKYRDRSHDRSKTIEFLFNSCKLNQNSTVVEARLFNNAKISVIETQGIMGGS